MYSDIRECKLTLIKAIVRRPAAIKNINYSSNRITREKVERKFQSDEMRDFVHLRLFIRDELGDVRAVSTIKRRLPGVNSLFIKKKFTFY